MTKEYKNDYWILNENWYSQKTNDGKILWQVIEKFAQG